jgi:hypothetical protein
LFSARSPSERNPRCAKLLQWSCLNVQVIFDAQPQKNFPSWQFILWISIAHIYRITTKELFFLTIYFVHRSYLSDNMVLAISKSIIVGFIFAHIST